MFVKSFKLAPKMKTGQGETHSADIAQKSCEVQLMNYVYNSAEGKHHLLEGELEAAAEVVVKWNLH